MFSGLLGAPAPEHKEQDEGDGAPAAGSAAGVPTAGWGSLFGNVAAAVGNTVKARADELVKAVQETDWKAELTAFGKEVKDDTQKVTAKTAELVEHLPEAMEQLSNSDKVQLPPADVGHALEMVQGSLSRLGATLMSGTKDVIEQLREGVEMEISVATKETRRAARASTKPVGAAGAAKLGAALQSTGKKYSRFEADVAAMQRDSGTYCDEPDDAADFESWRISSGFTVEGAQPAIQKLLGENSFMAELHARIVPVIVSPEEFWTRYFYRLHKLQQKEEQRLSLAQRAQAMAGGEGQEEELGWDDLDAEEEDKAGAKAGAAPGAPQESASGKTADLEPQPEPQPEPGASESSREAQQPGPPSSSSATSQQEAAAAPSTAGQSAGPSPSITDAGSKQQPGSASASDWCVVSERSASPDTPALSTPVEVPTTSGGGSSAAASGGGSLEQVSTPAPAASSPGTEPVACPPASQTPAAPKAAAPSGAAESPATASSPPAPARDVDDEEDYLNWGEGSPAPGAPGKPGPAGPAPKQADAQAKPGASGSKGATSTTAPPGKPPGKKAGDGNESPIDEDWGDWD